MPTNQQRRDAAKRKLERQLVNRQERARTRKQRNLVAGVIAAVVVIAGVIWFATARGSSDNEAADDAGTSADATTSAAPETPCMYPAAEAAVKAVNGPSNTNPAVTGTVNATVTLNSGVIPITLDRAQAPCAVNAFVSLASQGFYNDTTCHRLTTDDDLKILQCGDPSGTGRGGPGYDYALEYPPAPTEESVDPSASDTTSETDSETDATTAESTTEAEATESDSSDSAGSEAAETDAADSDSADSDAAQTTESDSESDSTETPAAEGTEGTDSAESSESTETTEAEPAYPIGTVAMANTGSGGLNGSQFFIVYGDTTLPSGSYTIIGTVDSAGLAVIDAIAAKGTKVGTNPNGALDAPTETVQIVTIEVPADAADAPGPAQTTSADVLPTDPMFDPSLTETVAPESLSTDSASTDPVTTDSVSTDPAATDPAATDDAATDTADESAATTESAAATG